MGNSLAAGIGSVFRTAAAGVGLVAGAAIGTALNKGFSRMVAIDDAKGKLAGLGHSAQAITEILANAKAAVDGTAFGLGEAATAAASAVAAGIKQGEDLTGYLKLIADTSTIAGSSLGEMGYVFNKVQSSGRAFTDDLSMLADRGIPIFQWLQEEYGVSAAALSKMVKKGSVDAETFRRVIQENIGGAADESGKTLRGAWKNMQASLGRIGEAALSPFLPMMKSSLGAIRDWANKIKPHVERASQYLATNLTEMGAAFKTHGESITGAASNWEKFGVKARFAVDGIRGVFSVLKDGKYLGANMTFGFAEDSKPVEYLLRFREAVISLWNAIKTRDLSGVKDFFNSLRGGEVSGNGYTEIKGIGETLTDTFRKLGDAASTIGRSMASILGDSGVVAAVFVEHFARALSFLADNTWAVSAGLAAYVAAMAATKAVHVGFEALTAFRNLLSPATIAAQTALSRALVMHNAAIREYLASIGREVAATPGMISGRLARARAWAQETYAANQATSALTRWSAAATTAAASSNALTGAMFRTAAGAAALGGRIQAAATTAVTGLGRAVAGTVNMLGGPWALAMAGAFAGYMVYRGHADKTKTVQDAFTSSVIASEKAQRKLQAALAETNGALDAKAIQAAGDLVEARLSGIRKIAAEGHSFGESLINFTDRLNSWDPTRNVGGNFFDGTRRGYEVTQRAIDENRALMTVLRAQKLEVDDLGKIVAAGGEQYTKFVTALEQTDAAGGRVAEQIKSARTEVQAMVDASRNSTAGVGSLKESIEVLSSTSADADDRVSALKKALDALAGKPVELQDAMQSYNDSIRGVISSAEKRWDSSKGIGAELIDMNGGINTTSENGSKLRDILKDLRDETASVAAAGGEMGPVFQRNTEVLRQLANAVGLSEAELTGLAESVGYVPKDIEILAELKGADEATAKLRLMQTLMNNHPEGVTIDTRLTNSAEIIAELQRMGAEIEKVDGKETVYEIKADNIQEVLNKVQQLIDAKIPDKRFKIFADSQNAAARMEQLGNPSAQGPLPVPRLPRAGGGEIFGAVSGAGGPTSDSIPALLSHNEHVWTSAEVDAVGGHGKMRGLRARALAGGLRFAEGGTPAGVERAIEAARAVEGKKYVWGGESLAEGGFDCSGFVGYIHQILMGIVEPTQRLYTTLSLLGGTTAGLEPGLGPSGTWFQVGVNADHMAATLAGMAIESGGAFGTSGIGGGRARATDSQFAQRFHLPNELIRGISSQMRGGKIIEWTAEDERELQRLIIAVDQAKKKRDEVYADTEDKYDDNDRRLADLDVQDAQARVVKKQEQKDKQGQLEGGQRVAPQAPALSRQYSEEEAERIDKFAAVEDANERRNAVYDDPMSSDLDRAKADAELSRAQQEANKKGKGKDSANTIRDVLTNAASSAVGAIFDAFKEQLPEKIGGSRWWGVADKAIALANEDKEDGENTNVLSGLPSFSPEEVMKQLGFTPGPDGQAPSWFEMLRPKVFDNGGWLMPGEMGINLSNSPEPIFNSPEQLRQFAGATLGQPQSGLSQQEIEQMIMSRPNVNITTDSVDEAVRALTTHQKAQAMKSYRR
ncbi:tape measure protein [Nocardia lijiangensis]|uniref:tape measure protein n=1 Tax=Nocardia lijiangensis TaxID=299618 RepID=UPI00082FDFE4|nr:tape measure protein [Nocardia lijiangensis]